MKKMTMVILLYANCTLTYAGQCSLDSISEPVMHLADYYRSQAATSFKVFCNQAYSIRFTSLNLRSSDGSSYVSNGNYQLKTQMSISGPVRNQWNVPLSQAGGSKDNKYVIAVRLEENPSVRTPVGTYSDVIYVSLLF
jgi:hypothetical protein